METTKVKLTEDQMEKVQAVKKPVLREYLMIALQAGHGKELKKAIGFGPTDLHNISTGARRYPEFYNDRIQTGIESALKISMIFPVAATMTENFIEQNKEKAKAAKEAADIPIMQTSENVLAFA